MINSLRVPTDGYIKISTIGIATRGYIIGTTSPVVKSKGAVVGKSKNNFDFDKDNNEVLLLVDIFTRIIG